MTHSKIYQGFSLIEVMVVVALLFILGGIALPNFRPWTENTKIRTGAESLVAGLQKAKTESLKRNARVRFILGANSAWTVGCTTAVGDTDGDGVVDCPAAIEQRSSGDGSSGVTVVSDPPGSTIVEFTGMGVKSTLAGQIESIAIDSGSLSASDSRDLRVTIGAGGNVRVCDPNASASDPRKC
jgi:type IV fimbrial biogenesis protein FimT